MAMSPRRVLGKNVKYYQTAWQFARKLAKICFSQAYQRIYVFSHKFWTYTHLGAACLWTARRLANNENVFHFDGQFPQFLNDTAVVTAFAFPEIIETDCSNVSHRSRLFRSEPFAFRFITICGLKWRASEGCVGLNFERLSFLGTLK